MDGIQMEPVGKYKADRNGSAKAAWRNMVDQDLDDVAFLADSDKAREAREAAETPIAVCSQRRAVCLTASIFAAIFGVALIVVYASPHPDCPCLVDNLLLPGETTAGSEAAAANKERIASNGAVFPWRGARLPTFIIPKHYSLWLHPNLTTGELRGEVSIDFKVDRDTTFLVLNHRDMNVTERALFKSGGSLGPKVAKTLDYPQADQSYIEFKDKLRRKYNYTLSLRFITKLERDDKQRGFFLTGSPRHRCAVSRFWLTHARSTFPCLDEPHFRATFKVTIVRDRFHVSLTNMPIVATEEAGFYLGHRLLQDEFSVSPPMAPHMVALAVCRLQRRSLPAPPLVAPSLVAPSLVAPLTVAAVSPPAPDDEDTTPEVSVYADQQSVLDDSGPFLEWVQRTVQMYSYELNTSYPLPKLDILVVEGGNPYSEGWGLITLSPTTLSDYKTIARLLAQQWFGGLVSPRWWSSQWLMEALTSVLAEHAPPPPASAPAPASATAPAPTPADTLLLDHVLPALRLDSSNSVRAVASPRLERADIEAATDELSLHKGAAIVSMAVEAAGAAAGRAALARLLRDHRAASADARDLWRALQANGNSSAPAQAWDGWCERAGYPLLSALVTGDDVLLKQERFVMSADPPEEFPELISSQLTQELRAELDELFYEPENFTYIDEDINSTTTSTPPPTTPRPPRTPRPPPPPRWTIPVTFTVGPLETDDAENITRIWKNGTESMHNGTWYDTGNETKVSRGSRWTENVTHLIWMNEGEMLVPDLGKHKWVRYNVGARGLYRVAPQDRNGESPAVAAQRAAALYSSGAAAERALQLDDAFVLSRAARLPTSAAIAAAAHLNTETHWAPWRVVLNHLSWWRELLRYSSVAPRINALLATLPPKHVKLYTNGEKAPSEDLLWLSGALLTAGVEWESPTVTKQAVELFDAWYQRNETIPLVYQEAALTAGVRVRGAAAWRACWRALTAACTAPVHTAHTARPALLAALAAATDDWTFYRFAYTVLSSEAQRSHEWELWITTLYSSTCRWRGPAAVWRVARSQQQAPPGPVAPPGSSRPAVTPPAALAAAARCLHQPTDYYTFKKLFGNLRGANVALDTIALNVAWTPRADQELSAYFHAIDNNNKL